MIGVDEFEVVVRRREQGAAEVALLELERPDGAILPHWAPGAHIDVILPDGDERQYSICADPGDRSWWRIGVLREQHGRGGSALLNEVAAGQKLTVRGPRNHFAFAPFPGRRYIFLAGGIGITPLYSMVAAAAAAGNEWELHYAGRSRSTMAFVEELVSTYGPSAHIYAGDAAERLDLDALLGQPQPNTVIYTCGPTRFIDAVEAAVAAGGWPSGSLRRERFEAKVLGEPVYPEPFEVELMLSGITVTVPPEKSILDVVEENGILVLSSCRVGTCGTCETPIIDGEIEHRDSVLSPEEQEDNFAMMICVSRAACPRITLEL